MSKTQRAVICRACHVQCGLLVTFEGEEPVASHGDKDNPVYHGYSCIKGRELARNHSLDSRLRTSMKRQPDGSHAPVAASAAMADIAERVRRLVDTHGPRSVALYIGTFGYNQFTGQGFALAFMDAIKSPMIFTSVTIDQPGKGIALALHGSWLAGSPTIEDWDALILVGTNPIISMNGGLGMNPARGLKQARERGMKLVVIDPRKTECAAQADLHLQCKPGEDPTLLAAIAREMIEERMIDRFFVETETQGFEALRKAVAPFTLDFAAERAGVPAEQIAAAARLYGVARHGAVGSGTGPNMSGRGSVTEYLVQVLMTLRGHRLRPGDERRNPGVLINPLPPIAAASGPRAAWGFGEKLRVRGLTDTAAGLPTAGLPDEILLDGEGQVKALFVLGGNPMLAFPDQFKTFEAMKKLELLVCLDPRMSETGRLADYVIAPTLPYEVEGNTALNEFVGTLGAGWGYSVPYAAACDPILPHPEGSDLVDEWEFFYGLARHLDKPLRVKTFADLDPAEGLRNGTDVDMTVKPSGSQVWDMILKGSPVPLSEVRKYPEGRIFDRPRTLIEPKPNGWEARLDIGSPDMMKDLEDVAAEGVTGRPRDPAYPFSVISRRLNDMHNSNWHENTVLQRRWPYNPAFINPADLEDLGIEKGDVVEVTSARATIYAVAEPAPDVRPGCISLSHAWGRNPGSEEDPFVDGANTGRLSFNDRDYEPRTGIPRMSTIPVQLRKADVSVDGDMETDEMNSLADIVRVQGKARRDAIAFDFEGRLTTFGALDARSNSTAQGLLSLGIKPQDRVGYVGKNCDLYFEILMGAAKAGAVMTPVNWRLAGPEIVYILNDAKVKVLFVGPEFVDLIHAIKADLAPDVTVLLVDAQRADWPDYAAWRDTHDPQDPNLPSGWEDVVLQLYTSGTTGRPKGAMLPNRGLLGLRDMDDAPEWNTWTEDDVSLVAMPCFHIGGTGWGIMGLFNGAKGVVMREFDPMAVLDYIETYRISKIFMVPAAMQIVVNQPKARSVDFSCLKYILYGASPIPLDLLRTCMEVFGCGFVQMYGMTETSGTIVALPPEDHDPKGNERMRSAGKPLPGVEVAILGADGTVLPPREVGEIATRSVANMSGYWNLPEATRSTLSDDGWLRTGDAGFMDEDGYVYIHDRVKDMIISGGENIYPAEVENAIFGHPDVADVAVVGIPSEKWGEEVLAVVVPKEGTDPSEDDIIAFARTRIAGYKCPKSVTFVDVLPRNPSGKILRRDLRAPYWDDQDRNVN